MSIDLEYAIKKDVKNNPVLREADGRERHEFRRVVLLIACAVAMLLFSTWQHFEMQAHGRRIEDLRIERAKEQVINRQLRLNLETLRSPQLVEERARRELGLSAPSIDKTIVIEREQSSPPASSALVAEAR